MNRNEEQFPEQEAPLKNTDQAFVQVGEDGQPKIPSVEEANKAKEEGQMKGEEARKHH